MKLIHFCSFQFEQNEMFSNFKIHFHLVGLFCKFVLTNLWVAWVNQSNHEHRHMESGGFAFTSFSVMKLIKHIL